MIRPYPILRGLPLRRGGRLIGISYSDPIGSLNTSASRFINTASGARSPSS